MDNWIATATGGRVFFDPIDVSEVKLRDLALGAARETRFNGQYRQDVAFYSVAEHCVWASHIAPPGYRIAALVHDAAEAFIKDITKPLKNLLPDYQQLERPFEDALRAKFNWPDWRNDIVKKVDMQMLAAERDALMNHYNRKWFGLDGVTFPKITFGHWLPSHAWVVWEDRYKQLQARGDY